ncbi:hypothetical protein [Jatrophihabitans sp.]|uniref:phage portal protein family protein n=1 Tax=Jatrophihabitans sp. TaxID=1932789 RepID=UPI0030C6F111|nr:hypothetical protein [Jatrophihabitans sp.]
MSAPTSLPGYMDDGALSLDGYGSLVDYLLEQIPELTHPWSVRTFAKMRHEPQLASILRVFTLSIERGKWSVNGAGCRDEVVQRIADDLGLPIKGAEPTETGARRRKFTFAGHQRLATSLSLTFGHAPFAQQWVEEAGAWRLLTVQERMPQTIDMVRLNPDGTLRSVFQGGYVGQPNAQEIKTANSQLVWYAREREGSNYFGRSLIRESYGPWLIKDQMIRMLATSHRRFGMGVPTVEAPPNATPQQIAEAERMATRMQASQTSGAGLPAGFSYKLTGLSGSVPDTLGFINYLDRQMTRSTLTSILDMATAERGSRSLGETIMQLMIYAQQAEANRIANDATQQIVIPLVDGNWGENEPAPTIVVEDVGIDDQLTAQDVNWLMQYGGLNPDDTLEEDLRKRKGLPPIDHKTRRLEITEQPPVDPNAPTTPPTEETP